MKVIREQSIWRIRWDFLILLLIVASILIISFQFAFQHQVTLAGSIIIYAIDLFFIIDLFFNFRTSFKQGGKEFTDKPILTNRYFKTNFWKDLLAVFPFDIFLLLWPDISIASISIVLWLRLFRLVRIQHLFVILRRWQNHDWLNPGYIRIARFFMVIFIVSHLIACAWYLSSYLSGFPNNCWMVLSQLVDQDLATVYIRSLYWTITTLTTVGYGDITPHLNYEYIITIIVMVIGASMYALIIGNIASLISHLDVQKVAYRTRIDSIKLYLKHRNVAPQLNERVQNFFEYRWAFHRGMDEDLFLNDLPEPLRLEVMMQLTKKLLENVPLFKYSSPNLKNILLLALKPKTFDPDSLLVRSGEKAKEIIFISSGQVDIISEHTSTKYCSMCKGEYFGDLSILLGENRTAAAQAKDFCETFILYSDDFFRIKKEYPEFTEVLKKMSSEKSEKATKLLLEGIIL